MTRVQGGFHTQPLKFGRARYDEDKVLDSFEHPQALHEGAPVGGLQDARAGQHDKSSAVRARVISSEKGVELVHGRTKAFRDLAASPCPSSAAPSFLFGEAPCMGQLAGGLHSCRFVACLHPIPDILSFQHARRFWVLASFSLRGAHVPSYAPLPCSRKPCQNAKLAGRACLSVWAWPRARRAEGLEPTFYPKVRALSFLLCASLGAHHSAHHD